MPTATQTKPKPAAKRTAKATPAKKATARKPAARVSGAPKDLIELTIDKLTPSPLNPRKAFDQAGIDELAASLKIDGRVFQNLVARKWAGKGKATHEIIAGERRYRAATQLVKAGDWPADRPVPVLVIEADDAKVIELATVENVQRKDLTPLEEARAFAQLRNLGRTTDEIALAVSMSLRHVQLRLQLIDTLTTEGQAALERGDISFAQARSLMLAKDAERQDSLLNIVLRPDYIGDEWTPHEIRERILADTIPESRAIFPVEQYTGSFIADTDDEELRHFEDVAQFEALQEDAISKLEAELKERWSWVKLVRGYYSSYEYEACSEGNTDDAGTVIQVDYDHSVKVHDGLVKRSQSSSTGPSTSIGAGTSAPQPPFTKKQLTYAHNRKTEALQEAVLRSPRTAKVLVCLSLIGADRTVRMSADRIEADDRALHRNVAGVLDGFRATLGSKRFTDDSLGRGHLQLCYDERGNELSVYKTIEALDDAELDRLFTALVAGRVGTFSGYEPRLGDLPLPCTLAADLNVNLLEHWCIDDEYLAMLKKPRLIEILDAIAPFDKDGKAEAQKKTAKELREIVKTKTLESMRVLPREMQFGSESNLEAGEALAFEQAGVLG